MEPLCTVTVIAYEGHASTTVKCGPNRTFEEVLLGLEKAKAAVQTQIDNKQQCPMSGHDVQPTKGTSSVSREQMLGALAVHWRVLLAQDYSVVEGSATDAFAICAKQLHGLLESSEWRNAHWQALSERQTKTNKTKKET